MILEFVVWSLDARLPSIIFWWKEKNLQEASGICQCHLVWVTWSCSLVLEKRWSCNNWLKPNLPRKALNWTEQILPIIAPKDNAQVVWMNHVFLKMFLAPTPLVHGFSLLNGGWSWHTSAIRLFEVKMFSTQQDQGEVHGFDGLRIWCRFVAFFDQLSTRFC